MSVTIYAKIDKEISKIKWLQVNSFHCFIDNLTPQNRQFF